MYSNVFEEDAIGPTSEEERAILTVRRFMFRSDRYREPFIELAKKAREVYETWRPQSRSLIQRANLKLPFGFTIVETEIPQILDMFVKDRNIIQVQATRDRGMPFEDIISDFLDDQLENMDFHNKFAVYIKDMLLDGTAIAKVPYRFKEKEVIKRQPQVDPKTGEQSEKKFNVMEVVYDGPDFENIPIIDFFPDWASKIPGDIQSQRGCVHRTRTTLAALKSTLGADGKCIYKNLDKLEFSVNTRGDNAWGDPYFNTERFKKELEELADVRYTHIKDAGNIELWEYWGLYDVDNEGNFEERVITIANGDVLLRNRENYYDKKFKPFVATPNLFRDNEFYGISELSAVRALIKEANTIRNARLDNINLAVNPMWLADRNCGINTKSLFSRPGGIVWANDINGIKPLQLQDPSLGSMNELNGIQQDIQTATANLNSNGAVAQMSRSLGRSATGAQMIQQMSGSRIGLKARMISKTLFKNLSKLMMIINQQYFTDEQWVRLSDPNVENPFATLDPDCFAYDFDFVIKTDYESGDANAQMQKIQQVAQILQVAEQTQPGVTNFQVVLEAMLRPILGHDVKKFTHTQEEMQQMQAQKLAMQQAQNQQQGKAAPQPNAGTPQQAVGSAVGGGAPGMGVQ